MKIDPKRFHIFASSLSTVAPSSNYRGESDDNRLKLQTIRASNNQDYAMISSEAIRNAIREMMTEFGLPVGRTRLRNESQLAVQYDGFPTADKAADHFFLGFMVADSTKIKENPGLPFRRDSLLLVNNAVATTPFHGEEQLLQSPMDKGSSNNSALIHREISHTSFRYPWSLPLRHCFEKPEWTRQLLEIMGQLNGVAGGHARSYFELAPASIVIRLTTELASGFDLYGYDSTGYFTPLDRISDKDLDGSEFWVAGEVVRSMPEAKRKHLESQGVHMFENPVRCMKALGDLIFGKEAPAA